MITVIDETNNDDSAASKQSSPETKDETVNEDSSPAKAAPAALSFPFPPPSMVNAPKSNSDLMSRLQNFLPQMESANQELLSMPLGSIGTDPVRLDTNLQLDDEDSGSDDDDEGSQTSNPLIQEVDKTKEKQTNNERASANKTTNEKNSAAPTIQLEFTLGNMTGNPLMKLLSNDDDDDDDDDDDSISDNGDDNVNAAARKTAISNLLTESQNSSETKNNITLLDGSNKNTNKKPLIAELS